MTNYGVVLHKLREINQLTIKQAAKVIGRSAGWLSQIENDRGEARIGLEEFERIVGAYDGQKHRNKFSLWIANAHKPSKGRERIGFDGAILKYLREKAKLSTIDASEKLDMSVTHLCNLENGQRAISQDIRNRLLSCYGYSPSSYKNFTTEDKRAKNIPTRYKLNILIIQMNEEMIEKVFLSASQILNLVELK